MGIIQNKLPWNLRQRGRLDSDRHAKKIREAIKKNLHHIISQESIITSDGKRMTRIPVKYLDSYHFRHGKMRDGVAHGEGDIGDVIKHGRKNLDPDSGDKAGEQAGRDVYEAEISVEELTEMMMEDLGLPYFEKKDKKQVITKHIEFTDIRKKGPMSNWAKRQTVMENIRRNALEGKQAKFDDLKNEDMRFRTWDERIERHSNAVIYLMMDRSGSMDEHKRYLTKATFWWLCRFLEKLYDKVDIVFIAHDFEAKVVPEKDFFALSNDGGTRVSSAYELCWKDIQESRPQSSWNVYCFHFSDGDNMSDDNERCIEIVQKMLDRINMFAYGEVAWENKEWHERSELITALKAIKHPRLVTKILRDKADVYPTLKKFLAKEIGQRTGLEDEEKAPETSEGI
jgi:hypothetical protein